MTKGCFEIVLGKEAREGIPALYCSAMLCLVSGEDKSEFHKLCLAKVNCVIKSRCRSAFMLDCRVNQVCSVSEIITLALLG